MNKKILILIFAIVLLVGIVSAEDPCFTHANCPSWDTFDYESYFCSGCAIQSVDGGTTSVISHGYNEEENSWSEVTLSFDVQTYPGNCITVATDYYNDYSSFCRPLGNHNEFLTMQCIDDTDCSDQIAGRSHCYRDPNCVGDLSLPCNIKEDGFCGCRENENCGPHKACLWSQEEEVVGECVECVIDSDCDWSQVGLVPFTCDWAGTTSAYCRKMESYEVTESEIRFIKPEPDDEYSVFAKRPITLSNERFEWIYGPTLDHDWDSPATDEWYYNFQLIYDGSNEIIANLYFKKGLSFNKDTVGFDYGSSDDSIELDSWYYTSLQSSSEADRLLEDTQKTVYARVDVYGKNFSDDHFSSIPIATTDWVKFELSLTEPEEETGTGTGTDPGTGPGTEDEPPDGDIDRDAPGKTNPDNTCDTDFNTKGCKDMFGNNDLADNLLGEWNTLLPQLCIDSNGLTIGDCYEESCKPLGKIEYCHPANANKLLVYYNLPENTVIAEDPDSENIIYVHEDLEDNIIVNKMDCLTAQALMYENCEFNEAYWKIEDTEGQATKVRIIAEGTPVCFGRDFKITLMEGGLNGGEVNSIAINFPEVVRFTEKLEGKAIVDVEWNVGTISKFMEAGKLTYYFVIEEFPLTDYQNVDPLFQPDNLYVELPQVQSKSSKDHEDNPEDNSITGVLELDSANLPPPYYPEDSEIISKLRTEINAEAGKTAAFLQTSALASYNRAKAQSCSAEGNIVCATYHTRKSREVMIGFINSNQGTEEERNQLKLKLMRDDSLRALEIAAMANEMNQKMWIDRLAVGFWKGKAVQADQAEESQGVLGNILDIIWKTIESVNVNTILYHLAGYGDIQAAESIIKAEAINLLTEIISSGLANNIYDATDMIWTTDLEGNEILHEAVQERLQRFVDEQQITSGSGMGGPLLFDFSQPNNIQITNNAALVTFIVLDPMLKFAHDNSNTIPSQDDYETELLEVAKRYDSSGNSRIADQIAISLIHSSTETARKEALGIAKDIQGVGWDLSSDFADFGWASMLGIFPAYGAATKAVSAAFHGIKSIPAIVVVTSRLPTIQVTETLTRIGLERAAPLFTKSTKYITGELVLPEVLGQIHPALGVMADALTIPGPSSLKRSLGAANLNRMKPKHSGKVRIDDNGAISHVYYFGDGVSPDEFIQHYRNFPGFEQLDNGFSIETTLVNGKPPKKITILNEGAATGTKYADLDDVAKKLEDEVVNIINSERAAIRSATITRIKNEIQDIFDDLPESVTGTERFILARDQFLSNVAQRNNLKDIEFNAEKVVDTRNLRYENIEVSCPIAAQLASSTGVQFIRCRAKIGNANAKLTQLKNDFQSISEASIKNQDDAIKLYEIYKEITGLEYDINQFGRELDSLAELLNIEAEAKKKLRVETAQDEIKLGKDELIGDVTELKQSVEQELLKIKNDVDDDFMSVEHHEFPTEEPDIQGIIPKDGVFEKPALDVIDVRDDIRAHVKGNVWESWVDIVINGEVKSKQKVIYKDLSKSGNTKILSDASNQNNVVVTTSGKVRKLVGHSNQAANVFKGIKAVRDLRKKGLLTVTHRGAYIVKDGNKYWGVAYFDDFSSLNPKRLDNLGEEILAKGTTAERNAFINSMESLGEDYAGLMGTEIRYGTGEAFENVLWMQQDGKLRHFFIDFEDIIRRTERFDPLGFTDHHISADWSEVVRAMNSMTRNLESNSLKDSIRKSYLRGFFKKCGELDPEFKTGYAQTDDELIALVNQAVDKLGSHLN
ncbi:MAG: hypothetical protein U9O94_06885 [Nanoarchaeota archaeon]|nr:hypothetical protein [Nanoarchaeota archaeon]